MRTDGRTPNEIRPVRILPHVVRHAEGSVQVEFGHTHVICTASIEADVPKWIEGNRGWVTAEYGMLPRSTHSRMRRDKILDGGRTQEISRLIGRSLRAAVDLERMGPRVITVDCDVIQADGGTRTAAITGGFVALCLALRFLQDQGQIKDIPITSYVAAVSVGLKRGETLVDLNYDEDSTVDTDMNFVMNHKNEFIEVQGTAESGTFSYDQLLGLVSAARTQCQILIQKQREIVGPMLPASL
jgi:ribonuclease PH